MPNTRTFTKSFGAGELSPAMFGRIDDAQFQSGAASLLNFITTPTGPAQNRPGFAYVKGTKYSGTGSNGAARLMPFTYNNTQTMVLEVGNEYIRFHTQGATLQYSPTQPVFKPSGLVSYTIASPAVFTFTGHPFSTGDSVVLALSGVAPAGQFLSFPAGLGNGPYIVEYIDANTFNLLDPSTSTQVAITAAGRGSVGVQFNYAVGALVSFEGSVYYRTVLPPGTVPSGSFLDTNPATDAYWYALPTDLTFEIPTPYAVADVFNIHYVQSADVMTLVHPNYPPMELDRLGTTDWTLLPINFGANVATPQGVAVTASPGYLAKIASINTANPALITTVANHTLSLGDGIYITGLIATIGGGAATDLSGFYLVENVPINGNGDLINNQLSVMDYSGNNLDSTGWSGYTLSPGTIQYGTKIFNINSTYAVAALDPTGVNQSALSAPVTVLNNLDVPGSYNVITWEAVQGSTNYYVYKQKNGLWGYIGEASGTTFTDNNIAPDFTITPVNFDDPFAGADNYPAAVSYMEQRRCFAGTANQPQTLWMTNSGTESTLSYSLPTEATDRLEIKIASREVASIEHLVPLTSLLILTGSCEYAEYTSDGGPITPQTVGIRPQSYVGASNVQPWVVNNSLVYCAARGGHVREMGYNWQANGFITGDLSLRAAHLFDLLTIADMAYSKSPIPLLWFVSGNGNLLGLTYIPEEQIGAWHHHTTTGVFQSVACVAEGNEDVLYAVVQRQINGQTVNYVERMASRLVSTIQNCFFVDAGATYTAQSGPVTTISGLTWLEGCTVAVLADGCVQNQKVVRSGTITLDEPATVVQVGLPYTSQLQTLPLTMMVPGYGQGTQKNINKVYLRLYESGAAQVGPSSAPFIEAKIRTMEPYGAPPALRSGEVEIVTSPSWGYDAQLVVQQTDPLPLTVSALTLEVAVGG